MDLNFKRHLKACDAIEAELRGNLSPAEINLIRADVKSLGKEAWLIWSGRHAAAIVAFLAEPPSVRQRQLSWTLLEVRQRFLLAAIQRVRRAKRLLLHIDRHCLFPWAGGSGRDFAVRAAQAIDDIEGYPDTMWPFDPPDPFEDQS